MIFKILLNEQEYTPTIIILPSLITYADKTGGSQFTITLLANLCLSGKKIIVFTAYPMAKENFMGQVEGLDLSIGHISDTSNITVNSNKQIIFIESGNATLFIEALNQIKDIDERIICIKNFEIFENNIIEYCLQYKKIILSGNIDNSKIKEKIGSKKYESIIAFSKPEYPLPIIYTQGEKYSGYILTDNKIGNIKILENI